MWGLKCVLLKLFHLFNWQLSKANQSVYSAADEKLIDKNPPQKSLMSAFIVAVLKDIGDWHYFLLLSLAGCRDTGCVLA